MDFQCSGHSNVIKKTQSQMLFFASPSGANNQSGQNCNADTWKFDAHHFLQIFDEESDDAVKTPDMEDKDYLLTWNQSRDVSLEQWNNLWYPTLTWVVRSPSDL